jgi:hypothetical protein
MFSDIVNDESDHWNPMSQNPAIPKEILSYDCRLCGFCESAAKPLGCLHV